MRLVFADTSFFVALLSPDDSLHHRAIDLWNQIAPFHLVTSEIVLIELLNDFSGRHIRLRRSAQEFVDGMYAEGLMSRPECTIVHQTHSQFIAAYALYKSREDKGWSITDCASCLIMQGEGIQEALTHDKHFEQMGFKALLRADA